MIIISGSSSTAAKHSMPVLRDKYQVCAFDDDNGDIGNPDFLRKLFSEIKPQFFINCREFHDIEDAEYKREDAYRINGLNAGIIADVCRERNVHLIQISSSFVYESNEDRFYSENEKENPTNVYGDSKLLGERKISESGCKFCIIRVPYIYGKGDNFLTKYIQKIRDEEDIELIKKQVIMPTYAKDLGLLLSAAVEHTLEGIFNFSNTGEMTIKEFLMKFSEIYNKAGTKILLPKIKEIEYNDFLSPVDWPMYNKIDLNKIKSRNIIEIRSVLDSLKDFISENYSSI